MNDTKVRGNRNSDSRSRLGSTAATIIVVAVLVLAAALIWIVANDPSILPGLPGLPGVDLPGTDGHGKDPGVIGPR